MRYKAKDGFELKDIADELLLLPRGADTVENNYVMIFNETGALIYRAMSNYVNIDTLSDLLVEKYSISKDEAKMDILAYVEKMYAAGIIEKED